MLEELENWLDRKINKLDRDNQSLKASDNKIDKIIWKLFFKRSKKYLDIMVGSALRGRSSKTRPDKIIHVVNLIDPAKIKDKSLKKRLELALESIEKAKDKNVVLLGCSSEGLSRTGWKTHKLTRDAKTDLKGERDFAFLNDMLDAANKIARKGDIIFYSNLDCPIHPNTYKNLFNNNENITEFIRRDIPTVDSYEDIFSQRFENYEIGVDGLAIKKDIFQKSKKLFPDFVIGEPHWDTAMSGILHQAYDVHQNTEDLYHIKHEQQWNDNNLSTAGKHNKRLYRASVDYGLMTDELISIKKNCAIIILKHSLSDKNNKTISDNLRKLRNLSARNEVVFCEYRENSSKFLKQINKMSYLAITPTNERVKKLKQKHAIINLIRHYFSNHRYIIIIPEESKVPDIKKINEIKKCIKGASKIKKTEYIALNTKETKDRVFNFYLENAEEYPNINKDSFINDDGLLELIQNEKNGHIQPDPMPSKRAKK